ncbi:hypothetical protein ACFQW6_06810 [Nocardioides sp. GCM10028917]|jgi:hypothetical protein|uniref:hypothetical protein n=1 Tax=Nocardioides sp. GCM10028917 TaxID=3273408 RepID=UPI00361EF0B4
MGEHACPSDGDPDGWAWGIALAPLLLVPALVAFFVTDARPLVPLTLVVALGVVAGSTLATMRDVRRLRLAGIRMVGLFTPAVLLFYPIGAIAYLVYRTRKAGRRTAIPWTWILSVGVVVLHPALIPA